MKNFIETFNQGMSVKKLHDEITLCNDKTSEYGLKLTEEDITELIKTRSYVLNKSGRVEFNGEIIDKIIMNFCDSPYISQYNYGDTINELIEIFYNYKNETMDVIGDDELIEIMKENFDNYCRGSLELLEGKVLYKIAENIRNGVHDYTDISQDKDI